MELKDHLGQDLIVLDELMPGQFSGTKKGIIQFYRDLIIVCQQNIGRTTCYGTLISERFIDGLVTRLNELTIGSMLTFHDIYETPKN